MGSPKPVTFLLSRPTIRMDFSTPSHGKKTALSAEKNATKLAAQRRDEVSPGRKTGVRVAKIPSRGGGDTKCDGPNRYFFDTGLGPAALTSRGASNCSKFLAKRSDSSAAVWS